MLKIKDNVDLKELEKFGFVLEQSMKNGNFYYVFCRLFIDDNRFIQQYDIYNAYCIIDYELSPNEVDTLYDLIKAGLVEKVNKYER